MHFTSLDDILDFAIAKEKEAVQFYSRLAKEESFSGAREMFTEFAREEGRHERLLLEFKSRGTAEAVRDYPLRWIKDIKRSDFAVEVEYRPGMAYNEILLLAMKREEKALKLYNEFLRQAETAEAKKIFQVLCQEEAKHKLALETLYDDYMAKMGD
ncbi:MAG: ferritin family protein [Desulfobacterales bacterium]